MSKQFKYALLIIATLFAIGYFIVNWYNQKATNEITSEVNIPAQNAGDILMSNPTTNDKDTLSAGQEKIQGTFTISSEGMVPNVVFFQQTFESNNWSFTNQDFAKEELKINSAGTLGKNNCNYILGEAVITYSDKTKGYYPDDIGIKLITVDRIVSPAKCYKEL